jgi:hypothetical protein
MADITQQKKLKLFERPELVRVIALLARSRINGLGGNTCEVCPLQLAVQAWHG